MLKRVSKQYLSLLLALLIGISAFAGIPSKASAADAQAKANDQVSLLVDGAAADSGMILYADGVYESGVRLGAGEHTYRVAVNGSAKAENVPVDVPADETVYIRYYAHGSSDPAVQNNTVDSINNPSHFKTSGTITGNLGTIGTELGIGAWDPSDPDGDLAYLGGGRYSKTFTFSQTQSEVDIEYKVAYNHSWSNGEVGGNVEMKVPAGSTSFTVFADYLQGVCTDSVSQPAIDIYQSDPSVGNISKPAFTTTVSLIGTVRGGDGDWDIGADGWSFSQITKTLYAFSKTFDQGSYQYKVVFDGKTWYDKTGNRTVAIDNDNTNVVFLYDAESQSLYDTVNNYNSIAALLGYQSAAAQPKVVNHANGTTEFLIPGEAADQITLTYAPHDAPDRTKTAALSAEKDGYGKFSGAFTSGDLYFGDGALDCIYYYTVNGTRALDPSAETVSVNGQDYSGYTREAFSGRSVYVPGTLPGVSWDAGSNQMTYLGSGLYACTFRNVPPANYQYKIAVGGSWDENYGMYGNPSGDNINLSVYGTQDVTVYYSDITHLSVTSLNYTFADVGLTGASIPVDTKLTDSGLTGIYTAAVTLPAGSYHDIGIVWNDKSGGAATYNVLPFTLSGARDVTFYFDPSTELFYSDASDRKIDGTNVCYNTQDSKYKSVYGAIEQNKPVTFSIQTGDDVTQAYLFVKGPENKRISMAKASAADGEALWSTTQSFASIGQYTYYFGLASASDVKVYCDDDGYYEAGKLTDLNSILPYALIVYKAGYQTPDWMKNAVIYQIFPDRFYNGDSSNDQAQKTARGATEYEFVGDWGEYPENPEQETLHPDEYPSQAYRGDGIWSNEIYGGDLKGITEKISYIKKLGANVIYINPVFSSVSSHRYDTSDYTKIDPILGTEGDFTELCRAAGANGMHIILDGVFNHVSDDSVYFDRYYKFVGQDGKVGAYPYWAYVYDYMSDHPDATQTAAEAAAKAYFVGRGVTDFTYTQWFTVNKDPLLDQDTRQAVQDTLGERAGKNVYGYEGWWGYDSMPVIKATDGSEYRTPGWAQDLIDGDNSAAKYWIEKGSDGWRLDCANEVSDETWQKFRASVKSLGDDNVIIGEIWDDAAKYLLGDMYDSCMNYQFRNAILAYARGGDSADSVQTLEKLRERYPSEAFYAMMNLLDSHDTTRLLSYLDGVDDDRGQKDAAHAFPTYATTSDAAKQKQYMAALLQLTYPGAPTIYYGDEVGMAGADDPDDRRTMDWSGSNQDLFNWYAKLISLRKNYSALRTGSISMLPTGDNAVLSYVRADSSNQLLVATNNSAAAVTVSLDASAVKSNTLTNLITNAAVTKNNGSVTVTIPAYSGVLLVNNAAAPAPAPSPAPSSPSIPSAVSDGGSNATADLTGATLPSGVTSVSFSAEKKSPSDQSDRQVANVARSALSDKDLSIIGTPVIYNLKLLDQNGNQITSFSGKVKVRVPVPSGLRGTPRVFRYEAGSNTFLDLHATVESGCLVFETDHFSYYVIGGTGDSLTLDTLNYTMPSGGHYQIGLKLTGKKAASVKIHSTNDKVATVSKLKNGNYGVTGRAYGVVYIMFDIYNKNDKFLSHASVKVTVKKNAKPSGSAVRQVGLF